MSRSPLLTERLILSQLWNRSVNQLIMKVLAMISTKHHIMLWVVRNKQPWFNLTLEEMQPGLSLKQPIQAWWGEAVETITGRSKILSIHLMSLTTPHSVQLMLEATSASSFPLDMASMIMWNLKPIQWLCRLLMSIVTASIIMTLMPTYPFINDSMIIAKEKAQRGPHFMRNAISD